MLSTRLSVLLLVVAAQAFGGLAWSAEQGRPLQHSAPAVDSSSTEARVIVKYRSGASVLSSGSSTSKSALSASTESAGPQLAETMGGRLGVTLSNGRTLGARSQVLQALGMSSKVLAEKLAADSDVEWAVVDGRRYAAGTYTPNDPLYAAGQTSTTPVAGQWYLRAPTSTIKSSIDVETAWAITQGSSTVVVAVLDTGILKNHPDLSGKLLSGYDFISNTTVANDGDGRDADPSDPGDWVTSSEAASGTLKDCTVESSSWHGTQTASLIGAATNNGIGMAGVAPNVMIMPVRVLGKCGGYDSDIIAGMRWAAGLSGTGVTAPTTPAKVLNLSLGATGSCSAAYQSAISELTAAGVVVVAAAGNDGLAVATPANCTGVIAVAGVRHSGTKVGFSDLGPEVALSAPAGNCVNSTGTCLYPIITATNTGTTSPNTSSAGYTYSNGSSYSVGTSFSAPLVSGTVALMMSATSGLTPGQITSLLQSSATAFPTTGATDSTVAACLAPSSTAQTSECYCTTTTCGAGLLNTGAAVTAAAALAQPTAVVTASATMALAGETITLDGSGSMAPSGRSIASYLWKITSGSAYASFSTSTTASSVTLLGVAEGTVTVSLTATDSAGQTNTATKTVAIATGKPTASFTASTTTPVVGATVTLDGSASSAQGSAKVSSYLWEITSGTSLASFTGSTTASSATLSATAAGTVVVRLTVTDNNGYTGSSSQTLTVSTTASTSGTTGTTTSTGTTSTSSSSGGGGGGAMSAAWLLALALLCLGLKIGRSVAARRAGRR